MAFDLQAFNVEYRRWVDEGKADYEAGRTAEVVKRYPLVVSTDVPWTPYTGTAAQQTVALVTSGGLYLKDRQPPFDTSSIHGDTSFREIPRSARGPDVGLAHPHYDHSLAEQDINVIFPLERLIELERDGVVGRVADTHYSFSYVNDVATLLTQSVPQLLRKLKAAAVDIVLLVPV